MRGLLRQLRKIMGSRWFAGLLLLILAIVVGGRYANEDRLEELWKYHITEFPERQTARALVLHGSDLPEVDEARVIRIADDAKGSKSVRLHPPLTNMTKYVVKEHLLTGEEARTLASLWRGLERGPGYLAACHDPHHVIRFSRRGGQVSQIFICFRCGNATLPAFPKAVPVYFAGSGYSESPDYRHFKSVIEGYVGKGTEEPRRKPKAQQ